MRFQPWVLNACVALVVAWSCRADATTILFDENESTGGGREISSNTTVSVTNGGVALGTCPGTITPTTPLPCVRRTGGGNESAPAPTTAVATLAVPTNTFLDPDTTRLLSDVPAPGPGDVHIARAYLLDGGAISDLVTLEFFSGGQFGGGAGVFDEVELRFDSDSPEGSLGVLPNGFINDFRLQENGQAQTLNGVFFTGPVDDFNLQRAYCQRPPCSTSADLPMGYIVMARSSNAPEPVPEPSALLLLGMGLAGLGMARRTRA